MTVNSARPLTEVYHDWISATVDEKGFEIAHGMVVDNAGAMTVLALAVPGTEAYLHMLKQWGVSDGRSTEAIFALDRFTKPGQGTTLGDVMAGFHFTRDAAPRPFVVEYQHAPRIVKPYEWNNLHWNSALYNELNAALCLVLGISQL